MIATKVGRNLVASMRRLSRHFAYKLTQSQLDALTVLQVLLRVRFRVRVRDRFMDRVRLTVMAVTMIYV